MSFYGGRMNFDINSLYSIVKSRIRSRNIKSYSYIIYKNSKEINKKLIEEAKELIRTRNKKQVVWEASDLLYFLMLFLVKRGVKIKEILRELEKRNKIKLIKTENENLSY